jgi:hypothetical protein
MFLPPNGTNATRPGSGLAEIQIVVLGVFGYGFLVSYTAVDLVNFTNAFYISILYSVNEPQRA